MSHWDGERIVRWPDEPIADNPGWTKIDCGCCAGIKWGGDEPVPCRNCKGSGLLCRHEVSGRLALYPGGPFAGREPVRA